MKSDSDKPGPRSRVALSQKTRQTTCRTDILISIEPVYMEYIVSRRKDHEFRNYLISHTVKRMWLYVSSPEQILKYIAVISKGKKPGEIENEEGMGNADFNSGNNPSQYSGFGYEIKELYQLCHPLPLKEMQRKYSASFPQRFAYVSDKMVKDIVVEEQIRLF